MREIAQATLFNLRWLTVKYYKKKGFAPLDISHWPPYKIPSIKRMLCTTNKKSDVLFLKDEKEKPYAILLIKDWGRVVGVNQCYQVERLKGLLKNENVELDGLKLILISRSGFSESVKRFARKQDLELKLASYQNRLITVIKSVQEKQDIEILDKLHGEMSHFRKGADLCV